MHILDSMCLRRIHVREEAGMANMDQVTLSAHHKRTAVIDHWVLVPMLPVGFSFSKQLQLHSQRVIAIDMAHMLSLKLYSE